MNRLWIIITVISLPLTLIILPLIFHQVASDSSACDAAQTLVWGPGLQADVVLPVRYLFIQARDAEGNNITRSLGEQPFLIQITSRSPDKESPRLRIWTQLLDRHDGSYIVRSKLMESYRDLVISITHGGRDVAGSPYFLDGWVYHKKCYCPQRKIKRWMESMKCPKMYDQIEKDLEMFKSIDMHFVTKQLTERYNQRGQHSLCHYVVKDNRVYRRTYGEHVGFKMFMDAMLLSLTRKLRLPDLEFFVNLGDWPLERRGSGRDPAPLFSWCGSVETHDIVMPTYDVTESTLEMMGRVSLDLLSVQANTGPAWENKTSMSFWRGRDSRQERLDLVKLSRRHPDVLDARLTNMFFFQHSDDLGELVKHVSFYDFFAHRYQISVDGTVAAYRLPYLLAGDSVVLKQDSPYYEHFYSSLQPYVHYVPFGRDLGDLLEQIRWARENDDKVRGIAASAQEFVRSNLMPRDVFCYHAVLFKEYSKRLVSKVKVRDGMEEVGQPSDADSHCDCDRLDDNGDDDDKINREEL